LKLAGRFAVSALLLALVARFVDVGDVLGRLTDLRPRWVLVGLAISVPQMLVLAWRWSYTAGRLGIRLPVRTALAEYYLSVLLNQILPGGIAGDVSRAWRHSRMDAPARPVVTAVVLERATGQAVMTLLAIVSALTLPWAPGVVRLGLGGALSFWLVLAFRAAVRRGAADGEGLGADVRRALLGDALGVQLVTAAFVVATYVATFLVAARAVGIDTPALRLLPLVAPVLMTMLVPVTVAGWGIREAAAAALWGLVGLGPTDGAAISVAYGVLVLVASLPGALALVPARHGGRSVR
jgi:uncharacterized membrane protein YbhN (UPF0104 family)